MEAHSSEKKATEKQAKRIIYELMQARIECKEGMMTAIDNLDIGTASDIIGYFAKNQPQLALAQLHHLHPDLF